MATNTQAPEILRIPVAELDTSALPVGVREPFIDAFETAVMLHFISRYAARGCNASVTTSSGVIRVVAWAEDGPRPKEYVAGLLANGALEEALPLHEAIDERGRPEVTNGLCLSKLHHTAYDRNLLGIEPDGQIHIAESVLAEHDGPTLEAAIKEYHGRRIHLPRHAEDRPDRELLAARFEEFRAGL